MITYYFGAIGSGKTTLATSIAQRELIKDNYEHIYTNFDCAGCEKIDFFQIGKVYIENSLVIIDEAGIFADSRDYKTFPKYITEFLILSRHYGVDFAFFSQSWGDSDKKIRSLAQRLYYVKRGYIFPFVKFKRIYKEIVVDEVTHDIVEGYRFANLKEIFLFLLNPFRFLGFVKRHGPLLGKVFAPKYYKYFDSYDRPLVLADWSPSVWSEPEPFSVH